MELLASLSAGAKSSLYHRNPQTQPQVLASWAEPRALIYERHNYISEINAKLGAKLTQLSTASDLLYRTSEIRIDPAPVKVNSAPKWEKQQ